MTTPQPATEPTFTVNGALRHFGQAPVHATALRWLRDNGLTGSKEGCAEGECGACAIMVAESDRDGGTRWTAINSCLVPMAALDGQEIVTAEGLSTGDELHPVQEAMAAAGGSQCGYCTPGFVCSMAAEFYRPGRCSSGSHTEAASFDEDAAVSEHAHEQGPNGFDLHALSGNLCRCTGYRPIRDAAYSLGEPTNDQFAARRAEKAPEFRDTSVVRRDGQFVRATTLQSATQLLSENPGALLIAGSTDWGVEVNIRARKVALAIAIDSVPELNRIVVGDNGIEIGAAATLSDVERVLDGRVPLLQQLIPQFASRLIRNRATFGGNLGTGSPIGDGAPTLLALDAVLVLTSVSGEREVALSEFFTGYRATVKQPDELIRAIRIPLPLASHTAFHKIAKRRFDDISSVAIAFALQIDDGVVTQARIGLGGVAATPLRAFATEEVLTGAPFTSDSVRRAAAVLGSEGTPLSDHRASSEYRAIMLSRAMLKFGEQHLSVAEAAS